ncbi:transcription factor PAR2-like [Punica granatum]|uniref:Uncharacterized protein n=2 Tax=Punica granatum TaxID=22663 RepID=A0A218XXX8_PUNGR|nr:transcription factor PAR2-like [Punica granatum]OWM89628.1 hypothetical protein CDL15_Pgr024376 [Punica granatum]PKI47251.1 hypothetical protein CRG98_032388 [Punica granatum]
MQSTTSIMSCRRALWTTKLVAAKSGKRRRWQKRAAAYRLVQMKVRKLQRLIPGGRRLQPDRIFSRTADYILQLRWQVNVLQALSEIYRP